MRPGTAASRVLACSVLAACAAPIRWATENDVARLEPGAIAGERAAIRALFELRADGAVAESSNTILGDTIRRCPVVFLQELQRSGRTYLDGILGGLGPELVDEFELQCREMRLRIASLQTVDVPELAELRDRCVARLQQSIGERSS